MTLDDIARQASNATDLLIGSKAHEHPAVYASRWNAAYFAEVDRLRAECGCWYQGVPCPKPAGWGLAPIPFNGG